MSQSVTLKDIAREANLSVGAVSKALAGYPHISEATRKRVRRISQQLNYQPRGQRRSSGQERRVKLVFTGVDRMARYAGHWLPALTQAAGRVELRLELSGFQDAEGDAWLAELRREAADAVGMLIFGYLDSVGLETVRRLEHPCVVVGDIARATPHPAAQVHRVDSDKQAMGCFATEHLIAAGHQRIGFFCAAPYPSGGWNDQWLMGYRLALMKAGMPDDPALRPVFEMRNRDEVGVDAARYMAGLDEPPTAYVIPTVHATARFRQAMRQFGQEIGPEQVVMGGRTEEARDYGLESYPMVAENVPEMAALAADLLARLADNPTLPPAQTVAPFELHSFPSQDHLTQEPRP